MKTTALSSVGVVAFALATITARGQTIEATLNEISPAINVKGTFDGGTTTQTYRSGVFQFSSSSFGGFDFEAFCVQPTSFITVGDTLNYEVSDTSTLRNSDAIARVIGGFLNSAQDASQAAAAQWAIWELVQESPSGSQNLNDGQVNISSSNQATATLGNQYLANLSTFDAGEIFYLKNDGKQDMVTWGPGTAVPEPSALALLALSTGLVFRRKR